MRAKVDADPALRAQYGAIWDNIDASLAHYSRIWDRYWIAERGDYFRGGGFQSQYTDSPRRWCVTLRSRRNRINRGLRSIPMRIFRTAANAAVNRAH